MKRLELFEFEDYNWLPKFIRNAITNLIQVLHKISGTPKMISEILLKIKREYDFDQIVDLGSGSGGPMIEAIKLMNKNNEVENVSLILSDLHPNTTVIEKIKNSNTPLISYHPTSINATNLKDTPPGLKTMIASFHHMNPVKARAILHSAQQNKQAIFIYEIGQNTIPTLLWWILLPISLIILFIMTWIMTPFVKGLGWKQLLFTYLIPIIPLVYAWDGQASIMRTYTFKDIESMIGNLDQENYKWSIEVAEKSNGKKQGYFIKGIPKN